MSLEGEDVLQQRCAAVSTLWIVVWFGAETELLLIVIMTLCSNVWLDLFQNVLMT